MNILLINKFEKDLTNLINNSGIAIQDAYYIVTNASLQLKILYNDLLEKERNGENKEQEHETYVDFTEEEQK